MATCKDIGVSKTAYGKWESDLTKPNFQNINSLCEFYDISKDELMSSEKELSINNNTFNDSPNLINSPNSTLNYLSSEIIEKILDNQQIISEIVKKQDLLFDELIKK